jgi:hypothetical protein
MLPRAGGASSGPSASRGLLVCSRNVGTRADVNQHFIHPPPLCSGHRNAYRFVPGAYELIVLPPSPLATVQLAGHVPRIRWPNKTLPFAEQVAETCRLFAWHPRTPSELSVT